ncbi:MAG: single-stranded DNA-binding protein [Eubacterium sp.]|nr:single-stranded DNA-binding protein [Eubacterium sp.]
MNRVILMGRLTRDPDIRYSQGENGMEVARYTLAVDRRRRRDDNQQSADFISCVAFGRQAEFAEKYLRKGVKIVVSGRIQTGSYTNREGNRVYTTDVVIEDQEFAESKGASDANSAAYSAPQNAAPAPGPAPSSGGFGMDSPDGFMNIPDGIDEELPFQ